MKPRMLCTDCGALAHPDTLLEGSDAVEMLGWLCFGIPGWLYCWWRHWLRIKVCPECGSQALVREARASAATRVSWESPDEPSTLRVANLAGPVRWPGALRSPRQRLRRGSLAVLFWLGVACTWGLAVSGLLPAVAGMALTPTLALVGGSWLARETCRIARMHDSLQACRAWDARGRPLRIEVI